MGKTTQLDWASGLSTLNIERKKEKKLEIEKEEERKKDKLK